MDGLLSLLLFGVLLFVMMRFGCGAHIMHGGHGSQGEGARSAGSQAPGKDLVCGMEVAADKGYSFSGVARRTAYCSRDWLDKFEASPATFAAPVAGKT